MRLFVLGFMESQWYEYANKICLDSNVTVSAEQHEFSKYFYIGTVFNDREETGVAMAIICTSCCNYGAWTKSSRLLSH